MNQATGIFQAAFAKIITLILAAAVCMVAAALVAFIITRRNPQWTRATKRLVHSVCIFAGAVVFAVFLVMRIRAGT